MIISPKRSSGETASMRSCPRHSNPSLPHTQRQRAIRGLTEGTQVPTSGSDTCRPPRGGGGYQTPNFRGRYEKRGQKREISGPKGPLNMKMSKLRPKGGRYAAGPYLNHWSPPWQTEFQSSLSKGSGGFLWSGWSRPSRVQVQNICGTYLEAMSCWKLSFCHSPYSGYCALSAVCFLLWQYSFWRILIQTSCEPQLVKSVVIQYPVSLVFVKFDSIFTKLA